ncbi:hypothetical protein [Microbacterium hibisci]|uniref:hypothetical protein n=1 Tax=Microbacterium hibisci TaxID=2036000 RepID=UPI00194230D3|nr:hypothetical protein [Microbacterium hibisci]
MFAVYAAEQQYHHDTWTRDREQRVLAAIRERRLAALAPQPATHVVAATARPQRAVWARPIGLHAAKEHPAACAVA